LTKFWLTKPKTFTWLNTAEKIRIIRNITKIQSGYPKKTTSFQSAKYLKTKFYTNKQKQILAQIGRLKKKNKTVYLKLFKLLQYKKSQILQKFIKKLIQICNKNKSTIQKMNKVYQFSLSLNKHASKKTPPYKPYAHIAFRRLKHQKLILFSKLLKKKIKFSYQNKIFNEKFFSH